MSSREQAMARVAAAVQQAGFDPTHVLVADADGPTPPPGPWVLVRPPDTHGAWTVGGVSRGQFRPYGQAPDQQAATDLVIQLLAPPAHSIPATEELTARGQATGQAILARTRARDGAPGPAGTVPGDVLDVVGTDTGHHLFALGTLFPHRSQPPTDAGGPYTRYQITAPLSNAQEGVVAPWFDQPGGGPMIVLPHPIRWHIDHHQLTPLT